MSRLPVPVPTPETAPFWAGTAQGRLRLQRCEECGLAIHYPRTHCPGCTSAKLTWFDASGDATLWSYVILHRPEPPYTEQDVPYVIATVELAEGVRMTTNIVDVPPEPEYLHIDMPLRVRFVPRGDQWLAVFAPAPADAR